MNLETGKDNKILRTLAEPVERITPEIRELIRKMKKIMKTNNGVGLAAPQIGVQKQIFVAELLYEGEENGIFYAVINPKITNISKEKERLEEGCLSLPKLYGEVERPKKIQVEYLNEMGKKKRLRASGLLARIFQHEIDHLNGDLFIDKVKEVKNIKQ